ncbi:hypothetical protein H2200_010190 [Cladophialophora chaetospira]|uniref:Uncharacterized protein n=1 Tax=Cladophialophora chaetospira TaxID=386627 RepID=A0AA38X2I3_9EURO|nr:hypothetical protein H2200_010190 [Cladophialophora chaetospira]
MASGSVNSQHTAAAGPSTQASTTMTSGQPTYDKRVPESLTNLPHGYKYLTGFPPPWSSLPPNYLTLKEICATYPNHLDYEGLDAFIQWAWTPNQIWDTIPTYIQERIKSQQITKAAKPVTMFFHRRDRRNKALGGKAGVKALWDSPKLHNTNEEYGNAITYGLNPRARKSRAGGNSGKKSGEGSSVEDTPMEDDTASDEEDGSQTAETVEDDTDPDVMMGEANTDEGGDPATGAADDGVERLPSPLAPPPENVERFLQAEQERYQRARLMGESDWEETTTPLANGRELADAVDSNGEPLHAFLRDQVYFGNN